MPRSKAETVAKRMRRMAEEAGPGARLPTFRALMRDFDVSQATVATALRRLQGEGVVEARPGNGLFVAERANARPILLLCNAAHVVGPSPFWEILIEALVAPHQAHPGRLIVEFTSPILEPLDAVPVVKTLSASLWTKLQARQVGGVMAVCIDERLTWELERLGLPVVGFGCPSHNMIRVASLEACSLGVGELVRLGCRSIALYNAPHLDVHEVFTAALSAHGAREFPVPGTLAPSQERPLLGHRNRLIEHGMREAMRLFGGGKAGARPEGILSVDDTFTLGYVMGLQRIGLAPGRDVEIATHSNRGSPTLAAWRHALVRLEFDVAGIAEAMNVAVVQLARGETPNAGGWETSILMNEREGPLRTLMARPTVRRKAA